MAQILYLSNRYLTDIQLTVSLLCPIVRYPGTSDYINLERAMNYIKDIIGISLILSIDNYGNLKWYVDAEFVVHKYMRIYTGGFITMVIVRSYVQYSKQN